MSLNIERVAVIGAGQMGCGIAQVLASHASKSVTLFDVHEKSISTAKQRIEKSLNKLEQKGKLPNDNAAAVLNRIDFVTDINKTADHAFYIEAVIEQEKIKTELFEKLDALAAKEALFASNTSSIPITKLANATKRPDRFIGMHFMNPVPIMSLVEVIRSPLTSDATYADTVALAEAMGKKTVCSQDYAGFIVNRILMPMINEACFALYEGLASAEDIDTAMKLGTNQPMGPLALADFIGLDTCLYILEVMHHDLGDPKFRPCPLLRQKVSARLLGKKSGRGFFDYE